METYTLSETPPAPPQVPPQTPGAPEGAPDKPIPALFKKYGKYIMIGGGILALLFMFLLGMLISNSSGKNNTVTPTPTEAPSPTDLPVKTGPSVAPDETNSVIQYLPGKQYLDDSLAVVTKKEPFHAAFISVSRFEKEAAYTQYAKVNYYNGSSWFRENITTSIPDSDIVPNPLISGWTIKTTAGANSRDPNATRITIDKKEVSVTITKLGYAISTQSYPGYTKFIYFGEGTLTTAEGAVEAYIQYTQTYTSNAINLSFLSSPEKLTSSWLVFWDQEGTAYYLDTLASDQKNNPYQNYQTGVVLFANATSQKLNSMRTQKNSQNNQYSVSFSTNPQTQITYVVTSPLNKSTDRSYTWQSGVVTGNAITDRVTKTGVGLMETIQQVR